MDKDCDTCSFSSRVTGVLCKNFHCGPSRLNWKPLAPRDDHFAAIEILRGLVQDSYKSLIREQDKVKELREQLAEMGEDEKKLIAERNKYRDLYLNRLKQVAELHAELEELKKPVEKSCDTCRWVSELLR